MIFRTRKDKDNERFAKYMERVWDEMTPAQQDEFRKKYFTMHMGIMWYRKWGR